MTPAYEGADSACEERIKAAGFILAGGTSSRMGRDKALLELDGVPLVVRTARLFEVLVADVTVVGPREHYAPFGLRGIADYSRDSDAEGQREGPLAGIIAALTNSAAPWNLIVACDLPYLSHDWLNWILCRAASSEKLAVVPCAGRGPEPLAAVYRRECGPLLISAFSAGIRKVMEALSDLDVEFVDSAEWHSVDPTGKVLTNMNVYEDYLEAKTHYELRSGGNKTISPPTQRERKY
ncbi:MAG TPA: molybdenum cofactor guanylyltransferase [Candidatus Acidoferrales bacterium]|nr:molybdenum cofactor guanylyltransferase [Candidatus Acidoferrales bacterium]